MSRLNYARVTDRLLGGSMPYTERHVELLRAEGVAAVINLCEDREYWLGERESVERGYRDAGIVEHRLPVADGSTVPAGVLDRAVELAGTGTVYVHCRGGRERSATVCTAIIAREQGLDVTRALRRAREGNPGFRPLPGQLLGLAAWERRVAPA